MLIETTPAAVAVEAHAATSADSRPRIIMVDSSRVFQMIRYAEPSPQSPSQSVSEYLQPKIKDWEWY